MNEQRGLISKQRNAWLQTALLEAAKLAPRWNPQLAVLHARELQRGHANRATLQVARKLVAYLLAVDKSGPPFQVRTPWLPTGCASKRGRLRRLEFFEACRSITRCVSRDQQKRESPQVDSTELQAIAVL